jgi:hypothetical protein
MHKTPCQKPHSVSKIPNSVVPCAFVIQHQSGTWRDSDEYGWSSKNVQTDWHPNSLQARLTSMHIETAGTAWSGLPSDDEEGPWEVRRGYFLFCARDTMWRENYGSLCCFKAFFLNVFSHAHAFSRKLWTDDLFFSLPILWRKSISTLHVRMIWKYFSHVPFVVTQIRSEGPSFWSQAFLNFNSNALKVAKFRTPQLFGLSIDPRNILYFEWSPPSGMSSWHCILHTVWQVFWQFSFWHAIWLILWHVFWLSIWHTFWHIWWLTLYLTRIMVVTIYMTYFLTFYLTYIWTCCLIYYLICHDMIDIFGQTSWHRFWHSMYINSCKIYIYIYTIFYMTLRKPTFYKKITPVNTLDHPFLPTSSHAHIIRVYFSRSPSPHWSVVILNVK